MKQLSIIATLLLVLTTFSGKACDCAPSEDHDQLILNSYNEYPNIFIGEVFEDEGLFKVRIIEVFKGNLVFGISYKPGLDSNSCSFHFGKKKDIVLFYGEVRDTILYASLCSPTRSFLHPYLYPPPPPNPNLSKRKQKVRMEEYETAEKERLTYEINQLRKITCANGDYCPEGK